MPATTILQKSMDIKMKRSYLLYIIFIVFTITGGLLSRSHFVQLPVFISTYAGDTLWALMAFWIFCIIAPSWKTGKIGLLAILFSFVIEFSQFYHAPWIDSIRYTKLGGLILGFGFKFSDLLCYSVGVLSGTLIDLLLLKSKNR